MDKEFIPYEQALTLKELGFNRRTFAQYDTILNNKWILTFDLSEEGQYPKSTSACIAPTFSQAFRWFRDEYGLDKVIDNWAEQSVNGEIWSKAYQYYINGEAYTSYYKTYEEAELECLKQLIEIVKEK
jgi:hypothetical protein